MTADEPVHHITIDLSERQRLNLEALTGGTYGPDDVVGVVYKLLDHADQGVYRPGAWEREWLCQAFGYDWVEKMEKDPRHPDVSWQRPKAAPEAGPGKRTS